MSRLFCLLALAGVCLILMTGRADAVRLEPSQAPAGSVVDLHFFVTSSRDGAFTKKVQVLFPNAPAFEAADASAPAGWSSSVDALTGRVRSIEYESGKLDALQTGDFVATVTVPINGDRAVFKVLQTYSDGQVVQWTADPVDGEVTTDPSDLRAVSLGIVGGLATTTTAVPATTTTTVPAKGGSSSSFPLSTGQIFIGLGVAVLFTVVMRGRRLRKQAGK
jgi:uncharacterized protein YcnI